MRQAARDRVATLHAQGVTEARVYGEEEYGGLTRSSSSRTSRRSTGSRTRRTRYCRAGTTGRGTWARWSPRPSVCSRGSSRSARGASAGERARPCRSTSSPRRSGSGTSSGISSWAASPAAPTRWGSFRRSRWSRRGGGPGGVPRGFPAMVICPILLTLDPREALPVSWHMLFDARTLMPTFGVPGPRCRSAPGCGDLRPLLDRLAPSRPWCSTGASAIRWRSGSRACCGAASGGSS